MTCDALFRNGADGLAPALSAVDCLTGDLTTSAFGRLFGSQGAMTPVLTSVLTLYIAFFAVSLLTGRSVLNLSALTPRMLNLGLVLTFATSWIAYQQVVWNLAVNGPDWIASVLTGADGSATHIFAVRIDAVFAAIKDVSAAAEPPAPGAAAGLASPNTMMWIAGLIFMLGTVGLLVTAKIALAAVLMLGPVFIILAIFPATRGLFVGWLRATCVAALTPMIAVLAGSFMLKLIVPVINGIITGTGNGEGGAIPLLMLASVHMALMYVVLNMAMTMVGGWNVFGMAPSRKERSERISTSTAGGSYSVPGRTGEAPYAAHRAAAHSATSITSAINRMAPDGPAVSPLRADLVIGSSAGGDRTQGSPDHRPRGIGSQFRTPSCETRRKAVGEKF